MNRATAVLSHGPNVIITTGFWRIPHPSGANGVSIKVGSQNVKQVLDGEGLTHWIDSLEHDNPKFELTLTDN